MSTIAEFYSRNLAGEVSKGMNQKAQGGGTNGKAPMGYLNVTKRDELGREVRTVEVDPDRAPLITWAFEAYATGNYSTISLREELIDRGLTTVPTPKRPSKPPVLSTIHKMLTNPYYKGSVRFRGASYDGLHEPLVAPEVWYRVQAVLTAHQTSGEKTQSHDHYLKGSLYCGQCGSRLTLTNAKSRRGVIYPYFMCTGRHARRTNCERKSMFVPDIEAAVEDYYRHVQIPEHVVTALRELVTSEFDRLHQVAKHEAQGYKAERDALRDERTKLMQAHYAGAVPLDLLGTEQDRIARRLAFLDAQINAGDIEYDQAKAHLDDCLALAGDMHAIYMSIDDSLRRIANQAFFDKLIVTDDDAIHGEPGVPFNVFLDRDVQTLAVRQQGRTAESGTQTGDVVGLNNDLLVELRGFEPLTFSLRTRRATNCAMPESEDEHTTAPATPEIKKIAPGEDVSARPPVRSFGHGVGSDHARAASRRCVGVPVGSRGRGARPVAGRRPSRPRRPRAHLDPRAVAHGAQLRLVGGRREGRPAERLGPPGPRPRAGPGFPGRRRLAAHDDPPSRVGVHPCPRGAGRGGRPHRTRQVPHPRGSRHRRVRGVPPLGGGQLAQRPLPAAVAHRRVRRTPRLRRPVGRHRHAGRQHRPHPAPLPRQAAPPARRELA